MRTEYEVIKGETKLNGQWYAWIGSERPGLSENLAHLFFSVSPKWYCRTRKFWGHVKKALTPRPWF